MPKYRKIERPKNRPEGKVKRRCNRKVDPEGTVTHFVANCILAKQPRPRRRKSSPVSQTYIPNQPENYSPLSEKNVTNSTRKSTESLPQKTWSQIPPEKYHNIHHKIHSSFIASAIATYSSLVVKSVTHFCVLEY